MKFCMDHWVELKEAIRTRGLDHLVAQDGEAAMEATVREIEGTDEEKKDFDPLMRATWMIYGEALRICGLGLMMTGEGEEEPCPLCEIRKGFAEHAKRENVDHEWIEGVSDSLLKYARELGLVGGVQ